MDLAAKIMMYAIPGFFVLMGVEALLGWWQKRKVFTLADSINSLSLGTLSQIVGLYSKLLSIGIYAWVVQRVALWHLPAHSVLTWVSALVLYDFCYYWLHRMGHEVNVLWAAHVVHHQSERYNLTTALRQTGSGVLLGWLFYLPLAVLGYPVEVFAVVAVIDLLYQFWVHTETVPKLGWFDRVFCSPSNHRAHHAVNDRYIDKNYGGILIVWDRMFGTFVEEDDIDKPVYGTRSPLRSWNPIWANFEVYSGLFQDAWHARNWLDKLKVFLKPPGWRPADVAAKFPKPEFDIAREEFNPPVPRWISIHVLLQFVLLLFLGVRFLQNGAQLDWLGALGSVLFLVGELVLIGALLENEKHARWLQSVFLVTCAGVALVSGIWFDGSHITWSWRIFAASWAVLGCLMLWLGNREQATDATPAHAQSAS